MPPACAVLCSLPGAAVGAWVGRGVGGVDTRGLLGRAAAPHCARSFCSTLPLFAVHAVSCAARCRATAASTSCSFVRSSCAHLRTHLHTHTHACGHTCARTQTPANTPAHAHTDLRTRTLLVRSTLHALPHHFIPLVWHVFAWRRGHGDREPRIRTRSPSRHERGLRARIAFGAAGVRWSRLHAWLAAKPLPLLVEEGAAPRTGGTVLLDRQLPGRPHPRFCRAGWVRQGLPASFARHGRQCVAPVCVAVLRTCPVCVPGHTCSAVRRLRCDFGAAPWLLSPSPHGSHTHTFELACARAQWLCACEACPLIEGEPARAAQRDALCACVRPLLHRFVLCGAGEHQTSSEAPRAMSHPAARAPGRCTGLI